MAKKRRQNDLPDGTGKTSTTIPPTLKYASVIVGRGNMCHSMPGGSEGSFE